MVFGVYWAMRNHTARKVWLLVVSYVFYAAWDWRFLSLILVSTAVDYLVGRRLIDETNDRRRRLLLLTSMAVNLGLLGFFKYFGFFVDSAYGFLDWLGLGLDRPILQIVLPVGISFYTFQTMSYTIDAYRGALTPTRNLLDLALFVAFFPQLVAGPIVRAADFLPQLETKKRWASVPVRGAVVLFIVGFVKKAVVADNAAGLVDAYFSRPDLFPGWTVFLAVPAYAVQIYGDFSGYSDMAIATAALLGYTLPLNFYFPYYASNITEFWRRWHISLSTWLRDYLYIPLGGNRGGRIFTYRNLMLTMLLGGLWHGAAWRFVIWGGLHGVALIAHREWRRRIGDRRLLPSWLGKAVGVLVTFYWVNLAWIFFRAETLATAFEISSDFLFFFDGGRRALTTLSGALGVAEIALVLLLLAAVHGLNLVNAFARWRTLPSWAFAFGVGVVVPLLLALVPPENTPFIYFQF